MAKVKAKDGDKWVTLNGAKVLLGGDGKIKAGMGGKFAGMKITEIPETTPISPERLTEAGRDRIMGAQEPGEYFESENLSPLENDIRDYTAGGYELEKEVKTEIKSLIAESPVSTQPLYRVEELGSATSNLQPGDTFSRDIQSYSKSSSFTERLIGGYDDVTFDECSD